MDEETEANPASGEEVTVAEAQQALEPDTGAEAEETGEELDELDKLVMEPEAGDPEPIDVEYEGKTYKLPPELKDALLRQSDYTKKTMSVAEERRAVEEAKARIEEISSLTEESRTSFVKAAALRMQLEDLENTSTEGLTQEQLNTLMMRHQLLERNINQLEQQGKEAVEKEKATRSQHIATAREQAAAEAAKFIPNFESRRASISEFLASEGENPEQVISTIDNPAVWKVLNYADIGKKFMERQRKAKTVADAQRVQPAQQVSGKANSSKSPDAMSPSEMAKHLGY